jgi:Pyruvate/2-oxoacid:ferredoxin oxidoreductase gamma subunit
LKNVLIAGIGRQGINTLAKVLALACRAAGRSCHYTVHKGGAQSLGSVFAEMRIATGPLPVLGPSIPSGKLDILVAMDPWEALRHYHLANADTVFFVETETMPIFTDRSVPAERERALGNPVDQLNRLSPRIAWRNYRRDAMASAGTVNMANYFVGLDCLSALGLDGRGDYERLFFATIPAARHRRDA